MQKVKEKLEEVKVKDIFELGRGRVISHKEINENLGDYPVYSSQSKNNGEMGRINSYDFDGEYITWTTDGAYAGSVFYRNGKFNCTNVCGTLKAKSDKIDMRFLTFALGREAKKHVVYCGNPKLMNNVVAEIKILLPPFAEQKKIAEILSKVDENIEKTDEVIKKTEKLKAGLMRELLTKGIGHKNFKKTKLGMIPEEWRIEKIKDVCDNLDNKRIPVEKGKRERGAIPYYGATGIVDYVKDFIFNEELLLVGEDGADWSAYANSAYIIRGKSWVNNHAHILKCKKINIVFLRSFLNYSDLKKYITGTTRGKLNKNSLMEIIVPFPQKKEQEEIANILSKIDKKIEINKKAKTKLTSLRKGLMQDLLGNN
jgi:type I restriction enzyme, S subunit